MSVKYIGLDVHQATTVAAVCHTNLEVSQFVHNRNVPWFRFHQPQEKAGVRICVYPCFQG
jgi:hypothetical protein